MNQKIKIGNGGTFSLSDRNYLASGGEASVYVLNNKIYKLYHDPDKKHLPVQKMKELALIKNSQVIVPEDTIYDTKNGKPIGYTTKFVDKSEPLVKLFTKTFKSDNNISYKMVNDLVKKIQLIVADVHIAKCLIVDLNELNILAEINSTDILPWFIDTDSYCTPSYKATAVMDSIRDRRVTVFDKTGQMHYHPDEMSDWFSFAVIAFNLYCNIHPYRGNHPNYKPKDKRLQMDNGISVFHPSVRVPPSTNPFTVIPSRHLSWFKDIFLSNKRSVPPLPDSSIPLLVPSQMVTITGTDKVTVEEIYTFGDNVIDVFSIMGLYYVTTKSHIYCNKKEIGNNTYRKVLICSANDGTPIVAQQGDSNRITFRTLTSSDIIGTSSSDKMFRRNNSIYTLSHGKLLENSFTVFGTKIIHRINEVENVSTTSTGMYDGCVIQNLLGRVYLTLPYKQGSCFSKEIPQLNKYRVVVARGDRNIVVIVAECNGKYDRFVIIFNKDYSTFDVRVVSDVTYNTINFCVMDNGVCLLLNDDGDLELFTNNQKIEIVNNAPLSSDMKLVATPDGAFFINNNSLHQIKRK